MLKYGDPGYLEQNQAPTLYSITFSFLGVSIIMVTLRLYCRRYRLRAQRTTVSDLLIAASLAVDIASSILIHYQIHTGMGKHIEYSRARPAMLKLSMKVGLAQNTCYQALIGLVKMSILAQMYQFAKPGLQRRVVMWVAAFVFVFMLFTVFAAIFQCIPMKAAWDLQNFPKGCWNLTNVNFFTSSMNTFLDILIFALPLPTLWKLPTPFRKKLTLVLAYSMGLLALSCSVIRLRNIVHFNGEGDFTYAACMVPIWGAIECNAGIICASFPFLLPLIKRQPPAATAPITAPRGTKAAKALDTALAGLRVQEAETEQHGKMGLGVHDKIQGQATLGQQQGTMGQGTMNQQATTSPATQNPYPGGLHSSPNPDGLPNPGGFPNPATTTPAWPNAVGKGDTGLEMDRLDAVAFSARGEGGGGGGGV